MSINTSTQMTSPTGIEQDADLTLAASDAASDEGLSLQGGPFRLVCAEMVDQSDIHAEFLFEREWLLHISERDLKLRGNAFALENTLSGEGTVWLKLAPLPHARAHPSEWDVRVVRGESLILNRDDPYRWVSATYANGKWGRIAAAHRLQRELRPFNAERDALFLTNTWGDRGRDAHLNPTFMAREIESAARLGADIVQIDDGWQNGVSCNSALVQESGGGSWNGFWAAHPDFWGVNRTRFPDGLEPLIAQAHALGMKFGLWFAPDSSNGGANWEKDAQAITKLHRELGVDFFKIDGLKIKSPEGEAKLRQFFEMVARETQNRVTLDLDITAELRFGYFGLIEFGPLFVENRYTDFRRYWPHHTLRVAWQLSHWVDPSRLRLEWLNHARHVELYQGDPLAPANWKPDALFATVLFCAPLGWFETQHLPASYFEEAAPLIVKWKSHRAAIHAGTILPIGQAPDGAAWTGFVSLGEDRSSGYLLIFRELNPRDEWKCEIPFWEGKSGACEVLGGQGTAQIENGILHVKIEETLGFVWVKIGV